MVDLIFKGHDEQLFGDIESARRYFSERYARLNVPMPSPEEMAAEPGRSRKEEFEIMNSPDRLSDLIFD